MYCGKGCHNQRAGCILTKGAMIRGQDVLWQRVPQSEGRLYFDKGCHDQRAGCIVAKGATIRGQVVF